MSLTLQKYIKSMQIIRNFGQGPEPRSWMNNWSNRPEIRILHALDWSVALQDRAVARKLRKHSKAMIFLCFSEENGPKKLQNRSIFSRPRRAKEMQIWTRGKWLRGNSSPLDRLATVTKADLTKKIEKKFRAPSPAFGAWKNLTFNQIVGLSFWKTI